MKNYIKIIIAILIIIAVAFGIWKIATMKENMYNKVVFTNTNYTTNETQDKYLDTIVRVGLDELQMKGIVVRIRPMAKSIGNQDNFKDVELQAYIIGSGTQYIIYIKDTNRTEAINLISHELIHLTQYNDRSLVTENGTILWLGKVVDINNMAYFERPWEIDALEQQDVLAYKIRLALY